MKSTTTTCSSDIEDSNVEVTYFTMGKCDTCDGMGGWWDDGDIWHPCETCKGSGYNHRGRVDTLFYDTSACNPGWFVVVDPAENVQVGEDSNIYIQTTTGGVQETEEPKPEKSLSHLKPIIHLCGWKKWEFN